MGQERLSALTLMYVHHNVAVDAAAVVDAFLKRQPRRLELLYVEHRSVSVCIFSIIIELIRVKKITDFIEVDQTVILKTKSEVTGRNISLKSKFRVQVHPLAPCLPPLTVGILF